MRLLLGIARFELFQLLRRGSTWVYFGLLLLISGVVLLGRAGTWHSFDLGDPLRVANSPLRIASQMLIMQLLSVPIIAAMAGRAVHRDFETGSFPLFFTTPVPRWAYLGGRYLGAVAALAIVFAAVPLGIAVAAGSGFGEARRLAPFDPVPYLHAGLVLVLPNLLFIAALFLVLAALTRRMLPNYAGGFVLLVGWGIASILVAAIGEDTLIWLLDPFALIPTYRSVQYWTVVEQNRTYLSLPPLLLANRALWLGLGAAALLGGGAAFRFQHGGERDSGRAVGIDPGTAPALRPPRARLEHGARAALLQVRAVLRRALRDVVLNVWFVVILGACLLFVMVGAFDVGNVLGTRTFPVTYMVLDTMSGLFGIFILLIITIYAGELVWSERDRRVAGQADAAPVAGWVPLMGQVAALVVTVSVMLALCVVCGVMLQASRGYFRFELGVYLRELFVHDLVGTYLPLIALSVAIHTLVNQKYLGHFAVILFYLAVGFAGELGLEHNLLLFPGAPHPVYSDMNRWGHVEAAWRWYALYWNGVAALLLILAVVFRQRGEERSVRWRLRAARERLVPGLGGAVAVALAVVLGAGGWIAYNTLVLNEFTTSGVGERVQASYERRYKRYEWTAQPRVVGVKLEVDIFPERRDLVVRGEYRLRNRTAVPVPVVHVDLPSDLGIQRMDFDRPASRVIADSAGGYYAFRLARPLAPGDSAVFRFRVAVLNRGFPDDARYGPVLQNGTFFNQDQLPRIGYNAQGEITDPTERAERGLPPRLRMAVLEDARHHGRNDLSADADRVDFEATLSTSADQIAMAPGYLQRSWTRGGRRYFHYRMDAPILRFYSFQSARYAVRKARWGAVSIEVYYHPRHGYNVDRMLQATRRALDYYTRAFGPYQHHQVRILEFPRYADFAQSYPNTIPYSEGLGFIADVGADDVDYPFFVTAHEVAHQWWGHQLAAADVQGSAMLSETLAEYSALMVMEREFGRAQIGRFLEYDLDAYLKGRGAEDRAEMPLARVERQGYIHYNKGGLAMYALRDYIGERRVNQALRAFLSEWRFRGPPYPDSRDLLRHLRAVTPDSLRYVIDDLFERITLWDLRAAEGSYQALPGGRYRVRIPITARKLWADSIGNEQEVAMADWVDVGVYGPDGDEPIYLRKHRVASGQTEILVDVPSRPERAGIDPLHKLIDRDSQDNFGALTEERRPRGR